MATFRYFAYGSNMATERVRSRAPSARPVGVARLPRHVLRWHKRGRDGSGKCDISAADAADTDAVWGVLFDIECTDKPRLDAAEGLGVGYDARTVQVLAESGSCEALTYQARRSHIDARLRPTPWYKRHVVIGAREHGLPAAYQRALAAIRTTEDP